MKFGWSDLTLRFKCDSEWNQRPVSKMEKGGMFNQVESRTLRVGHVIKVDCDSELPADVVLLQVWFFLRFFFVMQFSPSPLPTPCYRAAIQMDVASFKPRTCTFHRRFKSTCEFSHVFNPKLQYTPKPFHMDGECDLKPRSCPSATASLPLPTLINSKIVIDAPRTNSGP